MDAERTTIVKKYRKSLKSIMEKYKLYDDESADSYDIFDETPSEGEEESSSMEFESISFIRKEKKETGISSKFISFTDVYNILCGENDFEDIFANLSKI